MEYELNTMETIQWSYKLDVAVCDVYAVCSVYAVYAIYAEKHLFAPRPRGEWLKALAPTPLATGPGLQGF